MRLVALLLALVILAAAALGGLAYYSYQKANEPYKGFTEDEIFYTITPGATSSSIASTLEDLGIIEDSRLFLAALWYREATQRLQAGEYRFWESASVFEVIERLERGDVYYLSVTVPEGLTLAETASLFEDKGLGDAKELEDLFEQPDLISSLDSKAPDLEGYLFPETYQLPRRPSAENITRSLVARFKSVYNDERQEKAKALSLTPRELVTLASIVEKETGQADERPLIASVFWNRMRIGMPLQSDPTVIYAMKRDGTYNGNLRRTDLEMDSPYNTYKYRGLPPGPIASPGLGSIDAVLNPPESKYLYFVSKNDGSHHFSKTLREHNNAVRKYQIEYFRNQRRKKKAANERES
jgi:UPF0755 protein